VLVIVFCSFIVTDVGSTEQRRRQGSPYPTAIERNARVEWGGRCDGTKITLAADE
jgi:hypothetical protein